MRGPTPATGGLALKELVLQVRLVPLLGSKRLDASGNGRRLEAVSLQLLRPLVQIARAFVCGQLTSDAT
jgi:hypothetical protein